MEFDILATIEVHTVKYSYQLYNNGKRNIDDRNPVKESFVFKFDSNAIEQIIFRRGQRVLYVDNKEMYFDYKNSEISGIHFEDDKFIWIVPKFKDFLMYCEYAYIKQKFAEMITQVSTTPHQIEMKVQKPKILDEFDLPDGITIESEPQVGFFNAMENDGTTESDYFDKE